MMTTLIASHPEVAAVEAAVRDYFEGWFEGDPGRMERALHPHLVKRSFLDDGSDLEEAQTAEEMIGLTEKGWGTRYGTEQRNFEVEIVEIYDGIATVVVRSAIYREYLHLARVGDRWRIVHALWVPAEDNS